MPANRRSLRASSISRGVFSQGSIHRLAPLVLVLFIFTSPALAQTPIACGEQVQGSIATPGEQDFYAFAALAGDAVTIRLSSTGFVFMALELLGPSGSQLQAATSNLFSQRVDATLTTTGIYTIVVRTARANDTGNYGVVWERPSNPCSRIINCGEQISSSIASAAEVDFYSFQALEGDAVTIRLSSAGFVFMALELYGPSGSRLQAATSNLFSQRIDATLPVNGTYTIVVGTTDPDTTSGYTVSWALLSRFCIPISFSVSPSSLSFSASAGSSLTPPQELELRSDFPGLPWRATVRIISGGIWLRVSSDFGQMPAVIEVTADATNLSAGAYQATIEMLAADASPPSQIIEVTFTVGSGNAPGLTVDPGNLSFQGDLGEAVPAQALRIGNSGTGTLSWQAQASTTSGAWLSLSPLSGLASASAPATLQVSALSSGLAVGFYSGTIVLSSPETSQTLSVSVSLSVSSGEGVLLLSQNSLLFRAAAEGGADPPQTFGVLNIGGGGLDWSAEAAVQQTVSWLQLTPASGRSVAGSSAIPEVTVSIDPAGLPAGFYVGLVRVTAPAANNSSQSLRVDLQVLPSGTPLGAVVRPTGLIFVGAASGAAPAAQQIRVATPEASPIEFLSASVGGEWVTRTPDSGTAVRDTPGSISVEAQPGALTPDVYRAGLTVLTSNDGELHPVNLLFLLLPAGSALPAGLGIGNLPWPVARLDGCTPTKLLLQFTSVFNRFNAIAGWPSLFQLNMRRSLPK